MNLDLFGGSFPEESQEEIEENDIYYSENLDNLEISETEKGFMTGYLNC